MSFLHFISPRSAKAVFAVLIVCAAAYGGWSFSNAQCVAVVSDIRAEQAASLAEAHQQARWQERRFQDAADQASQYHTELKIAQQRAKESLQTEVNTYVTSRDHINLSADWVFIHNLAACLASGASEATCRADGIAGFITDDQALKTVTDNYVSHCAKWRDQVLGWQKFYGGLKANTDTK